MQGDAEKLPFQPNVFPMVVSSWTSTDVEHFDLMLTEIAGVLRPGGGFLFHGVHPCFNGPHVETGEDRTRIVHTSYCQARRHVRSPWWGSEGIRMKAGGMRDIPLAEFINAFIDAALTITHVGEPDEEPVPYAIVITATAGAR